MRESGKEGEDPGRPNGGLRSMNESRRSEVEAEKFESRPTKAPILRGPSYSAVPNFNPGDADSTGERIQVSAMREKIRQETHRSGDLGQVGKKEDDS